MRKFGRRYVKDGRDQGFCLSCKRLEIGCRYWDDTQWWGDQKKTPQCVGFAWAHWLSAAPVRNRLNPEGIYTIAQYLDEWEGQNYEGTSVRAGAKVLQKLGFIQEYRWTWQVWELAATVAELGPVVVGTNWYEGMSRPKDGVIEPTGKLHGGHAWLITGVNNATNRFRMKNSWGRDWGEKGRAWISYSDMQKLLSQNGECCLGIEKKP